MRSLLIFLLILSLLSSAGCTANQQVSRVPKETTSKDETMSKADAALKIVRHPVPIDLKSRRGKLESLPVFDESSENGWQVDIRSTDISSIDLSGRLSDLLHADFDSDTKWPDKLPQAFDPTQVMELGKDPGLNVRKLHKKGITGKGVGIAVIDQTLLVDHIEYADRLKLYEEINIRRNEAAQMHGSAVASIAAGKTVGVAPEAALYYIAETHGTYTKDDFIWDFTYLAQSIDRILEINKSLPKDSKIRVISISVGWSKDLPGYKEVTEAVERAKKEGIFVVSSCLEETYGFRFNGLGRDGLSNPNDINLYGPGSWWADRYFAGSRSIGEDTLLVPMDSRCTAAPNGKDSYAFYSEGGWSWSTPYIAGLYALACQANPDVAPEVFWKEALNTGATIDIEKNGEIYSLGKIADPIKLIEKLESK